MHKTTVERLLNRIGMRVFIAFYDKFTDLTLGSGEIVDLLPREFTLKSRRSRTSKARRIFREGLEREALGAIAASKRVEPTTAESASQLLSRLTLR